jgi:hypothetical protein
MHTSKLKLFVFAGVLSISLTSCFKELNKIPVYDDSTEKIFSDPNNYIHALAKLYGGLLIEGNDGGGGRVDIQSFDPGASTYSRAWWILQQLPTDEAMVAWNDPGLPDMNFMNFNSLNPFVQITYNRIFFQIALINEFLRNTTEESMSSRGFSEADKVKIRAFRTEARFLRALSYWHAIDLFGNVPLIKEDFLPGSPAPQQATRAQLFEFVEQELLTIQNEMAPPQVGPGEMYGRANRAAAWMLLAKLYLNAEVYTGIPRYADAATYAERVVTQGGYSLNPNYRHNFVADNHNSPELIFVLPYDGQRTRSYGGTTFLMNACIGGSGISTSQQGANGWAGIRARKEFSRIWTDTTLDSRFTFFSNRTDSIINPQSFIQGWPTLKWRNRNADNSVASDPTRTFSDIDFPMFRLADAMLMYAECAARGAADVAQGVNYFNQLRERAYGNATNNITAAGLTLPVILNERARELYYEGHRRTDLIRYGLFTGGDYLWQFKGGVREGVAVPVHLNLYPLPATDLIANPNLTQNTGYGGN